MLTDGQKYLNMRSVGLPYCSYVITNIAGPGLPTRASGECLNITVPRLESIPVHDL
jgi:hypothetical protein